MEAIYEKKGKDRRRRELYIQTTGMRRIREEVAG